MFAELLHHAGINRSPHESRRVDSGRTALHAAEAEIERCDAVASVQDDPAGRRANREIAVALGNFFERVAGVGGRAWPFETDHELIGLSRRRQHAEKEFFGAHTALASARAQDDRAVADD